MVLENGRPKGGQGPQLNQYPIDSGRIATSAEVKAILVATNISQHIVGNIKELSRVGSKKPKG